MPGNRAALPRLSTKALLSFLSIPSGNLLSPSAMTASQNSQYLVGTKLDEPASRTNVFCVTSLTSASTSIGLFFRFCVGQTHVIHNANLHKVPGSAIWYISIPHVKSQGLKLLHFHGSYLASNDHSHQTLLFSGAQFLAEMTVRFDKLYVRVCKSNCNTKSSAAKDLIWARAAYPTEFLCVTHYLPWLSSGLQSCLISFCVRIYCISQ